MLLSDTTVVIRISEVGHLGTCQIGKCDVNQTFDTLFTCLAAVGCFPHKHNLHCFFHAGLRKAYLTVSNEKLYIRYLDDIPDSDISDFEDDIFSIQSQSTLSSEVCCITCSSVLCSPTVKADTYTSGRAP